MELSQGKIIQKPKMQELSSLFMTHRLNVMHAPIKFHEYIPYGLGVMARHGLLYGIKSRGNNSKTKNAGVFFLAHDTSSQYDACTGKVSWIYFIRFRSYGLDTVNCMELSQAEIIQKPKMQELSSLFMTHRLSVMQALVKFHEYISYGLGVMARTQLTIWN